jgi:hypothetical protein
MSSRSGYLQCAGVMAVTYNECTRHCVWSCAQKLASARCGSDVGGLFDYTTHLAGSSRMTRPLRPARGA